MSRPIPALHVAQRPFLAVLRCDAVVVAYDETLASRIRDIVQDEPGLTEKRMFGGLAFLINGNMAVSASGQGGMLLRVDPTDTATLVERPEASRFEMRGREMDGWLRIDPTGLATKRQLKSWGVSGRQLCPVAAGQVKSLQPANIRFCRSPWHTDHRDVRSDSCSSRNANVCRSMTAASWTRHWRFCRSPGPVY